MPGSENGAKGQAAGGSAGAAAGAGAPASGDDRAAPANRAEERFDEILGRLRGVVERLEGGNISLEDSLKFFEEGIDLCRRGATILDSAERKVEVLLGGPSGAPRTAPFDTPNGDDD